MKKIFYIAAIICASFFSSCDNNEDDVIATNQDENWWVNKDNPNSVLDHTIFQVYEQYKVPIFYNDTIGSQDRGTDVFGRPNIYYEVIKLNYMITGNINAADQAVYALSYDEGDIMEGVKLLRDYVLPNFPDFIDTPRSYLLGDTLHLGMNINGRLPYIGSAFAGITTVAVGKLSEIGNMGEDDKKMLAGEILNAQVGTYIYQTYDKTDLKPFYRVLQDDVNKYFSHGQKVDINNTSSFNPMYKPCIEYGFLNPAPDREIIEDELYYFPTYVQDVNDYVALYLGFTEAQVQEKYADYPHVLKKYGIMKEIIGKMRAEKLGNN